MMVTSFVSWWLVEALHWWDPVFCRHFYKYFGPVPQLSMIGEKANSDILNLGKSTYFEKVDTNCWKIAERCLLQKELGANVKEEKILPI